jgi:survival-of-motor-neuron-related-splicing factor 30
MADLTPEQLEQQIAEFSDQLADVENALRADPTNSELLDAKKSLGDVLKELHDIQELSKKIEKKDTATNNNNSSSSAKVKAVQEAAAAKGIYVGMLCEAIYSGDGQWYNARVNDINADGVLVVFDGYGNTDTIDPKKDVIRARQEKAPLAGKKRKEPETSSSVALEHIPKSLQILPTDSEKVRLMKKKRIKQLKSKTRFQQLEEDTTKKKSSWQDFLTAGNKKQKVTSAIAPKESIFRSPDSVDGRVGVVGSGKGMTPNPTSNVKPVVPVKKTTVELPFK